MHQRNLSTSTNSFGAQAPLFGQAANTSNSSFSFGSSQPVNTTTPAFGTQSTPFGQSAVSQSTSSNTGFSFGATEHTTPALSFGSTIQSTPSSSFGNNAQPTSSFSFGNTTQAAHSLAFGSAAQSKPTFSFGAPAPATNPPATLQTSFAIPQQNQSTFGGSANIPNQQQELQTWQQLALIKAKWDTKSPLCHFKHFFYNMVHPDEVHRYAKPADIDPYLWAEAMRNNPDPTCMVPTLAVGFDDVRKRMEGQYRTCAVFKERLEAIDQKIEQIQRKHILETMTRLAEHKRRHIDLTQRTIQFMKNSQLLRSKGFPIQVDEDKLRLQLEKAEIELQRSAQLNGSLNNLWNQVQDIRDNQRAAVLNEKWAFTNEKDVQAISEILSSQHDGLAHIISMCHVDMKDLDVMASMVNSKMDQAVGQE
ncbi:nucleoporin complex subunit 54-domain-containing protein [Umbelopsis sp. PMI_123]|nr:nucleoporin complex subunit 54-domain-containing protein [Umbelopsis sp. PMI_123]